MSERIIGIMGAIPQEINGVVSLLSNKKEVTIGKRSYFTGELKKIKVKIQNPKPPKSPIKWDGIAAVGTALLAVGKFAYDVLNHKR